MRHVINKYIDKDKDKEQSQRLLSLETFDQRDEEKWADQQKDKDI